MALLYCGFGRRARIQCDVETKLGNANDRVVGQLIDLANAAISRRLMVELEEAGELRWTNDLTLTLDSLRIYWTCPPKSLR
ncbi:hypothetical protein [Novipirellula artificiosorum]|uniref:Uncharacterized protein n=1 Tax=Novipirellula artificiosorum TaxID=2528016 RepID=A0A5C6E0Q9_9BACT|nr:hypothetical protein [Novipirellula artificiosorum]TWU42305.1 hypothetical protein Poly41_06010 [Novipirellula artificiosorum]